MAEGRAISVWRLKAIAFICGAAIMGLEMAGVRLLEPFLGSTIYVWGAIIGIFLAALSGGYFLGGRLADRSPHLGTLGIIITASALWIFAIPPAAVYVGENLAGSFNDPRTEAFIISLILYAAPSVLLGMASPFAVRLAAHELKSLGHIAGSLYAISTFGSIIGTFLVTFVLTEVIGTMSIVWGVAVVLLLAALLCIDRLPSAPVTALLLFVLACTGSGWHGARYADDQRRSHALFPQGHVNRIREQGTNLAMAESAYHLINVFDSSYNLDTQRFTSDGERARYMVFNNQVQSGCLTGPDGEVLRPVQTACGYARLLNLGVVVTGRAPVNVAIIGGGGGIAPQMFLEDYAQSIERIDVVDIDRMVFEFAQKYFGYPFGGNGKIFSHVVDGRLFFHTAPVKYDYIILDAYTAGGRIPRHLVTREFFELVRGSLSEDGVVVCNVISAVTGEDSRLLRAVAKTVDSVFGDSYIFPRSSQQSQASNVMLVATRAGGERMQPGALIARYNQLAGRLLKQSLMGQVQQVLARAPYDKSDPLLTDDFCPTDGMVR